jgi:alpha/beta superfamily hydrolase
VSEVPVAKRIDHQAGFSEEATFFDSGGQNVFGVLHQPLDSPSGGVVVCPSIHAEFVAGYRIDVAVARALASSGVAVQRFHPRGAGHSDGETEEMTLATMREDALVAADRLVEETGIAEVGFLGTRFGGLVAASAAAEHPASPVALIEPTLQAARFFRDAWRAMLIREVKAGRAPSPPGEGLADALARSETVDLLGYPISRGLFEGASGRTLVDELGDGRRRVLLVQLGRSPSVRGDIEAARAALRENGCEVDVELVSDDVMWWFPPGAETERPDRRGLVGLTSGWLADELTGALR